MMIKRGGQPARDAKDARSEMIFSTGCCKISLVQDFSRRQHRKIPRKLRQGVKAPANSPAQCFIHKIA
jgi:hypothetical protein